MSDPAATEQHDPYAPFRHKAFRIYIGSYVLAVISSAILSFSAKYEVSELTKKTEQPEFYLGLLGAVAAVPIICFSLPAGHVVDRFNRKTVLLVTQAILSICPAIFAAFAYANLLNVWIVYAVVLANGTALAFARPARSSLISTLVPRKHFSGAVTWNSTFFETCAIAGPMIGGFAVAGGSVGLALLISSASMAMCLAMSFALPKPPMLGGGQMLNVQSLLAGFRFVYRTRLMFATMSLDLFAVLFGGATYLLPLFSQKFGMGPLGLSLMVAAPGVGAITMALVQAHLPPFARAGRAMLLAVFGFGIVTIIFGFSNSFYLSLAMLVLMGAFDNVSVIVRHSLVQLLTPESMRGRVTAVNQVFIGSSNEIGGFESGMAARLLGSIERSVIFGGVMVLLIVVTIGARFPEVRRLGRLRDVTAPTDGADPATSTTPLQSTT